MKQLDLNNAFLNRMSGILVERVGIQSNQHFKTGLPLKLLPAAWTAYTKTGSSSAFQSGCCSVCSDTAQHVLAGSGEHSAASSTVPNLSSGESWHQGFWIGALRAGYSCASSALRQEGTSQPLSQSLVLGKTSSFRDCVSQACPVSSFLLTSLKLWSSYCSITRSQYSFAWLPTYSRVWVYLFLWVFVWHLCWAVSSAEGRKTHARYFISGKRETRSEVNRIHFSENGSKIGGEGKEMEIIDQGGF